MCWGVSPIFGQLQTACSCQGWFDGAHQCVGLSARLRVRRKNSSRNSAGWTTAVVAWWISPTGWRHQGADHGSSWESMIFPSKNSSKITQRTASLAMAKCMLQGDDEGLQPQVRHHHDGCARAVVAELEAGTPGALCSELSSVVNLCLPFCACFISVPRYSSQQSTAAELRSSFCIDSKFETIPKTAQWLGSTSIDRSRPKNRCRSLRKVYLHYSSLCPGFWWFRTSHNNHCVKMSKSVQTI